MSTLGDMVTLTLAGESHGPAITAILSGLPAGAPVDETEIAKQLWRRRGIRDASTAREEPDDFEILSGVFNGCTTGTPITIVIYNEDADSSDYEFSRLRPGHADYTAFCKYRGYQDYRGGGHFSGRVSAALVAAGTIARDALRFKGIFIGTHIAELGGICDRPFEKGGASLDELVKLDNMNFAVLDKDAAKQMKELIRDTRKAGDSLGGVLETSICGLPEGLGGPWFEGIESELSRGLFGIPGVKGVEFGAGFAAAKMKGSEANDGFKLDRLHRVVTETNNCGGILGGISDGMPVIFRCAVKPTPSIAKKQRTVDMSTMEETDIEIKGRHDAAIVARAAVIADSVTAICVCDLYSKRCGSDWAENFEEEPRWSTD